MNHLSSSNTSSESLDDLEADVAALQTSNEELTSDLATMKASQVASDTKQTEIESALAALETKFDNY